MMYKHLVAKAGKSVLLVLVVGLVFGFVDESLLSGFRPTVSSRNSIQHGRSISLVAKHPIYTNGDSKQQMVTPTVPYSFAASNNNKGFVFVFLHVPKSGGTTIRKGFQGREHVTYLFSNRKAKYDTLVERVDEWVQHGPQDTASSTTMEDNQKHDRQIGILEIHARNNPTLLDICQQLQDWRTTARQNDVPFFAFTILREPENFAISYFNYYHGMAWERRRFEYLPVPDMTDANFMRTMHKNPQCLFLTRSEQAYQRNFPELRQNLTKDECDQAYECLQRSMDWIGTTERLKNETLPLLHHLIGFGLSSINNNTIILDASTTSLSTTHEAAVLLQSSAQQTTMRTENPGPKIFGRHNMTGESLDYLKGMTDWDQEMYRKVLQDYDVRSFGLS